MQACRYCISVADKHCKIPKNRQASPAPSGSNQALQLLGRGSAGCLGEMPCLNFADSYFGIPLSWPREEVGLKWAARDDGFRGARLWQVSSARDSWILIGRANLDRGHFVGTAK